MPEEPWLNSVFMKYTLCEAMHLQPSEFDEMEMKEANVYWLIYLNIQDKKAEKAAIEASKQKSKA